MVAKSLSFGIYLMLASKFDQMAVRVAGNPLPILSGMELAAVGTLIHQKVQENC